MPNVNQLSKIERIKQLLRRIHGYTNHAVNAAADYASDKLPKHLEAGMRTLGPGVVGGAVGGLAAGHVMKQSAYMAGFADKCAEYQIPRELVKQALFGTKVPRELIPQAQGEGVFGNIGAGLTNLWRNEVASHWYGVGGPSATTKWLSNIGTYDKGNTIDDKTDVLNNEANNKTTIANKLEQQAAASNRVQQADARVKNPRPGFTTTNTVTNQFPLKTNFTSNPVPSGQASDTWRKDDPLNNGNK